MMADVEEIQVVVAHSERATLRVGDMFLKIDTDQARTDVEVEAMGMAPVPTPEILWRKPPVLALAALPGRRSAACRSRRPRRRRRGPRRVPPYARCTTRRCRHGPAAASTSSRPGSPASASGSSPTTSCPPTWSRATAGSPRPCSGRGHRCSSTATCRSPTSSSTVTRSPASSTGPRRPRATRCYDLATLTLAHEEHLDDVIAGYGADVDRDLIRAWWSFRSLIAIRWLAENGYGSPETFPEVAVLR